MSRDREVSETKAMRIALVTGIFPPDMAEPPLTPRTFAKSCLCLDTASRL
jgi:hypothetical protein